MSKWFPSFPGAREHEPGIHGAALMLGGMDSGLATSSRPGMTMGCLTIESENRLATRKRGIL